jgi:hypothetical protein
MITAAIAFVLAWGPTLAVGAGPLAGILGLVARFKPNAKVWLIIGAVILGIVTVAGASIHYMKLKDAAADWHAVAPKIAALEAALGCPQRPDEERELFACIPARDRDAEHARAEATRKEQEASARALDALQKKHDEVTRDLDAANELIEDATAADDGPLPKVMLDNWRRERARRGVK